MGEKKATICVYVREDQRDWLRQASKKLGRSQADIVRDALDLWLSAEQNFELSACIERSALLSQQELFCTRCGAAAGRNLTIGGMPCCERCLDDAIPY